MFWYTLNILPGERERSLPSFKTASKTIVSQPKIPFARNPAPNPIAPAVSAVWARLLLLLFPPKWPWCPPRPPPPPRPWCLPWCRKGLLCTLSALVAEDPRWWVGVNHNSSPAAVFLAGAWGAPRAISTEQQLTWDQIMWSIGLWAGLVGYIPEGTHGVSWSLLWGLHCSTSLLVSVLELFGPCRLRWQCYLQPAEGWPTLSQSDLHLSCLLVAEEARENIGTQVQYFS